MRLGRAWFGSLRCRARRVLRVTEKLQVLRFAQDDIFLNPISCCASQLATFTHAGSQEWRDNIYTDRSLTFGFVGDSAQSGFFAGVQDNRACEANGLTSILTSQEADYVAGTGGEGEVQRAARPDAA
jgi:hypothetical protein